MSLFLNSKTLLQTLLIPILFLIFARCFLLFSYFLFIFCSFQFCLSLMDLKNVAYRDLKQLLSLSDWSFFLDFFFFSSGFLSLSLSGGDFELYTFFRLRPFFFDIYFNSFLFAYIPKLLNRFFSRKYLSFLTGSYEQFLFFALLSFRDQLIFLLSFYLSKEFSISNRTYYFISSTCLPLYS